MANSPDYITAHNRAVALLAQYQHEAISIAERELANCLANGDTDGALRSDQVRRAVAFMLNHEATSAT